MVDEHIVKAETKKVLVMTSLNLLRNIKVGDKHKHLKDKVESSLMTLEFSQKQSLETLGGLHKSLKAEADNDLFADMLWVHNLKQLEREEKQYVALLHKEIELLMSFVEEIVVSDEKGKS